MYIIADAGSAFGSVISGIYFIGFALFGFYAWWKFTHKGMSDIERRGRAIGYGLAWPFFLFKVIAGKQQAQARQGDVDDAKKRILDG